MPQLIAIGGHAGTGKTTLAHALRRACPFLANAEITEDDAARRELLGYDLRIKMTPADYEPEVSARVRALIDQKIEAALQEGRPVIDASGFYRPEAQAHVETLAASLSVPFVGLWLTAPIDVLKARITKREQERLTCACLSVEAGHASDACHGVLEKYGDIGVPSSKAWHIVDASAEAAAVAAVCEGIVEEHLPIVTPDK